MPYMYPRDLAQGGLRGTSIESRTPNMPNPHPMRADESPPQLRNTNQLFKFCFSKKCGLFCQDEHVNDFFLNSSGSKVEIRIWISVSLLLRRYHEG